jgi:hypothetical protein
MKSYTRSFGFYLLFCLFAFSAACGSLDENASVDANAAANTSQHNFAPTVSADQNTVPVNQTAVSEEPQPPNLQADLLDERNKTTVSPLGNFDFKNYTYPLPRGWQDSDGKDAELVNGTRPASKEEKRIGLDYVTTKFFDATGDGQDEAAVILKIETTGSAIPQIVYIFEWKNDEPQLIWYFRTGDRADGGLKDIRVENGEVVVELYGQDRYIIGELDTMKITGDEEQICCPTHFTRSNYKWNGNVFRINGKRLTFSTSDKDAPPIENMVEITEKEGSKK